MRSPEETLAHGGGSCRDFAWLMVQVLRHQGLAARFVSGYSIQLVADEKPVDGPAGVTTDVTDLHAWAEVYLPGAGWVGLDPTCGLFCGEGYIPLAATADPQSAAPVTGSYAFDKAGDDDQVVEDFDFHMGVSRLHETPRVTLPYTDGQWDAITALGDRIDAVLADRDVRLTMGGEPTFVALDDRDADEWNTAAQGPHKRRLGGVLLQRLRDRFAPGGLLHFGQGKWYPGEQLPRWAFGCYWRRDGDPIWHNPSLIADEEKPSGATADTARRFITTLAGELGVDPAHAAAGFEDAWFYLWREKRLPANVDPLKSNLDDPTERDRLAKVFAQGLERRGGVRPAGAAGPLRAGAGVAERVVGGSPGTPVPVPRRQPNGLPPAARLAAVGTRSGPPVRRRARPVRPPRAAPQHPPDAAAGRGRHRQRRAEQPHRGHDAGTPPGRRGTGTTPATPPVAAAPTRRSSAPPCASSRANGTLYVFLPPARFLEDYLDIVAAVERTAETLGVPVRLEGYKPPADPRLNALGVTPDPGVIEVNVHPAVLVATRLVDTTVALYEEAKQTRLDSQKFMLDGRHTGTGGGNHLVMGGDTPADSPFLRRPDLLKSLVGFWNNHPSLSYLFSGLFVGPTSQHPRVDEARHDALHELNLAFKQVDPAGQHPAAGVADRPPVPPPAHGRDRQHPPGRVLHRQAVQPGHGRRPAGAAGTAQRSRCRRTPA